MWALGLRLAVTGAGHSRHTSAKECSTFPHPRSQRPNLICSQSLHPCHCTEHESGDGERAADGDADGVGA